MITIKKSNITFDSVYKEEYVPKDENFRKANCLILPYKNFREGVDCCFSEYAQEVLQYLKENSDGKILMDIAATDENYQEIELHSLRLQVGIFITNILLPFVVGLVSNYVYDKVKRLHRKESEVEVHVEYICEMPDGSSKSLNYEGPADKLGEITKNLKQLMDANASLPNHDKEGNK